jgi:N-acetylglucosamine kinase-like BadF-type ATPase
VLHRTDHGVIHPDGSVTLLGTGTQFGTLGICGTGSVRHVTEQQGTVSALPGRSRFMD